VGRTADAGGGETLQRLAGGAGPPVASLKVVGNEKNGGVEKKANVR